MSQKSKGQSARLDRLTDALVEDILASSDADLLAEAAADNDDGAGRARRAFERASRTVAVRRMERNKKPRSGRRLAPANIRALDPKTARGWLDAYLASNPETAGQLSRAVRRANKLSDEDVYGMLEALQQRGVLTEKPIEQSRR
jgi:hypothetical protein